MDTQADDFDQNLADASILIVDDTAENRLLTSHYLKREGIHTATAEDGAQAVERVRAENFDMILMDIHMPVLDGCEAAKQLREDGYDRPVIAVTATDLSEIADIQRQGVFDRILRKPILRAELVALVRAALEPPKKDTH